LIGAILGVGLGAVYALGSSVVQLDLGPIPEAVVGATVGGVAGAVLGTLIGGLGRAACNRASVIGAAAMLTILTLGRLADSAGSPVEKALDIVVAGVFYAAVATIVATAMFVSPPPAPPTPERPPGR
jgi:hypothetical protein